jgi:predicted dinucleotide-binding enzyme
MHPRDPHAACCPFAEAVVQTVGQECRVRLRIEYVWLVFGKPQGGFDVRIAVMAAAAVGGYFGGRMVAAGHDVAFIARGAHGDAIRRNGLKIESPLGDLHLKNVEVTDDPNQIGTVDVVLFAVKLWDTEVAGEQTRVLVGSKTRVITLQNGVDSSSDWHRYLAMTPPSAERLTSSRKLQDLG